MKPINKMLSLVRIATAVIGAVGLAVMVLSAQDDLDTVRQAAEQSDATAQFNLGIMYANGRGVLKDSVLAHMWSNIAGANGNASARELRDSLERDMTRAEISQATGLARACMASDYQDCESRDFRRALKVLSKPSSVDTIQSN